MIELPAQPTTRTDPLLIEVPSSPPPSPTIPDSTIVGESRTLPQGERPEEGFGGPSSLRVREEDGWGAKENPTGPFSPRTFGLLFGALCGLVGFWPVLHGAAHPSLWTTMAGLALVTAALVMPRLLVWPARVWQIFARGLGWLNTRILLGIAFFLLIVPLGLLRRLVHDDPLRRRFEPGRESYREPSVPRAPDHVDHKF